MYLDELTLILSFIIIGLFTFSFRAIFLYYLPSSFDSNQVLQRGLESVPSSLLVALVIPFTFFIDMTFLPNRPEVMAILLTIPIVYFIKKPGLSLPVALVLFFILSAI